MAQETPSLKKALNLVQATFFGVGLILGAGIYVVIGAVAQYAGNMTWLAVVLSGLIASFTGLSYAELSSMFPYASSSYYYTKEAMPNRKSIAFLVGWLLFFEAASGAATASVGFSSYLLSLLLSFHSLPEWLDAKLAMIILSTLVVIVFTIVNYIGISESSKVNIIFTLIEAFGLLVIIVIGFIFSRVQPNYFEPTNHGFYGILLGASLFFFAYTGFELMATTAEETIDAKYTMPKAIIAALAVTTTLYLLVALASVRLVPWDHLTGGAPLATAAESVLGVAGWYLLAFIALFSTSNTVLGFLVSSSRISYGMAVDGMLHPKLSYVDKKHRTPLYTILLAMIIAIFEIVVAGYASEITYDPTSGILKVSGIISIVASSANLGALIAFIFVNLAVIILRKTRKDLERPFKIPLNIGDIPIAPILGLALSLIVIALTFHDPVVWFITVVVLVVGVLIRRVK